jgi:hypothetical protein
LARQPTDFHSLETALFSAREIAEELGEVVVLYFIDMAIAETRMKNPPTANDHKPRTLLSWYFFSRSLYPYEYERRTPQPERSA